MKFLTVLTIQLDVPDLSAATAARARLVAAARADEAVVAVSAPAPVGAGR